MTKTRTLAGVLATAVTLSGIIACSPQETAVNPESHEPTSGGDKYVVMHYLSR
ncbi:MAG: hypothetical protein GDA56_08795 [Hormoscilla sp. GM7CHS1pb]|nr:hypothetical protein [Hormoscilla sp. GM7CHS1pb]